MAAGNAIPFDEFLYQVAQQNLNFATATVKMALLDNAYTPDFNLHKHWDDVSAQEISDVDYAQQTLTNTAVNQDVSGRTVFDADDVDFGNNVSISARYAVIYIDTGTPSTSVLCFLIDLNDGGSANVSSTNSDFDVAFNSAGIYRIDP